MALQTSLPRFGWKVASNQRGASTSAYQLLVASSMELLSRDQGDLWDSGKVVASDIIDAEYAGAPLASRARGFWKVRAWDAAGNPTDWSKPASFSIGLLKPDDWKAAWISDPVLADPINLPRVPVNCYRSNLESSADSPVIITLDLGSSKRMTAVHALPARPPNLPADIVTFLYPVRFKLEVSDDPNFKTATTAIDKTQSDLTPAPTARDAARRYSFQPVTGRYVRYTVTKLAHCDGQFYGIALGQLEILDGNTNIAADARVEASNSMEDTNWSQKFLTSPGKIAFAPLPKPIALQIPGVPVEHTASRSPLLRREFDITSDVRQAALYVSARGFYEAHINGQRVGDTLLTPGFTAYEKRSLYQTFDVTTALHKGKNAIGAMLAYGWYGGHMNLGDQRYIYGFFPKFIAQLEIETTDGARTIITSDEQWRSTLNGPIRFSDLLDGETYDCRLEKAGWDSAGFDDRDWKPVWTQPLDGANFTAQRSQPVRQIREMKPISVKKISEGDYAFDLGQEISGVCRLKVDGLAGTQITLRHGEWQNSDGTPDTRNLWGADSRDDFILDGRGTRILQPHFTVHGFRFVEIKGLVSPPNAETLVAIVLHNDVPDTGEFQSSEDLHNRLMSAVRWTQWNLMFDVPSGCAARGERLAWLGDVRPCVQTAAFNMDTAAFFEQYLYSIRDSQKDDGRFTDISPHAHLRGTDAAAGSPGWADCGVTLPWDQFVNYDDRRVLAENYEPAKRWVDFVHDHNSSLIWQHQRGQDWGDWLSAGANTTPKELGATAFFAHSVDLVSKMATALGYRDDAAKYHQLFLDIKTAFAARYVSADGKLQGDSQGAYALALQFDLIDEHVRAKAVAHLLQAIHAAGDHITTGFWSSDAIVQALSKVGRNDDAARLVNQTTEPSWGGMLAAGGTTFWESFDSMSPGKPVNLSLNHWTHSSIGQWLWNNVAGLNPDEDHPGYQNVIVRPRPWADECGCRSSFNSLRGIILIEWKKSGLQFHMSVTIPPTATATVCVPGTSSKITADADAKFLRDDAGFAFYSIGAGTYAFASR